MTGMKTIGMGSAGEPANGGRERRPTFGERVAQAVAARGPLCAGIDPSAALLGDWGLPDDASGLRVMGLRCVDAFAEVAAVVKPQVAFFERHGAAGMAALEEVLAAARSAGVLAIADAKRGDVSSTAAAYAAAWLSPTSPLVADAMTVVPYMGLGALDPIIDVAQREGRGVLVVVRSSNPEGRPVQEARNASGRSVEDELLAEIASRNAAERAATGTGAGTAGSIGAVVGATLAPSAFPLAELGGPLLAPGVGAQGAGPDDVAALFRGCPPGQVLPNVSRSLLATGPDVGALREAAKALAGEFASALG